MIIRTTASLAKRLKLKLGPTSEKSTTTLGDWYCNDVILNRRHFILGVSSNSRVALLIHAAPYSSFFKRLPVAIHQLAVAIGVNEEGLKSELVAMASVTLAKTEDRSIIGSMTDYRRNLEYMIEARRLDLDDLISISLRLSSIPCLVMEPSFPQDMALIKFGQNPQKHLVEF